MQTPESDNTPPKPRSNINKPVFLSSAGIIALFVIFGVIASNQAKSLFAALQGSILANFGWFYMLAVAIFLLFCVGLAVSRYGNIKLGPDHSEPDYSYPSWFAMLFSAGMGIGLMFYGVAEPIMHYANPPTGEGGTAAAAREAMSITFFHWGLHAWAIYAVVGLSLAYFSFRHKLPLTIRSSLYPLIGERIHGPIGHTVDTFAVVGTMFGIATSLGFGVIQVNAGLNYLFDIPTGIGVQIALIAIITGLATLSVVSGLDSGIKRISELNLILAVVLVVFVMLAGPTAELFRMLTQNVGTYLSEVVSKTFNLYSYARSDEPSEWVGGWTLFYWGWWISWSPFVGMFIARVSRGRTIREFITGVLVVPVGFTFIWMTFFGNTAISIDLASATGIISAAVSEDVATAIFVMFEQLPFSFISSLVATILVITFFVTSSDSGSLVIDTITSGGDEQSPVWQRIFWAASEGVVAAVLLLAGGLTALQTASIASALPFAVIMLFICYGLLKGLRMEGLRQIAHAAVPSHSPMTGQKGHWERRLRAIVHHPRRDEVQNFVSGTVMPALRDVAAELENQGVTAMMQEKENQVELMVSQGEEIDFLYSVHLRGYDAPGFALSNFGRNETEASIRKYYRAEVFLKDGSQHYDLMGSTRELVIADVLSQYDKHMHFLHMAR